MKIYVLTCVNENSDVVSVELFPTKDKARAAMLEQFESEKTDAEESGFEIDDYFSGTEDTTAGILYGETQYKWKITESEYVEDADRKLKEEFIERTYFEIKASEEDKEVYDLVEPVGDYDGFYLDCGNETIYVWNSVKRNYKSIFNIDVNDAYEIAKQLWKGEYNKAD